MVEHVGAAVLADVLGIVADQAVALAGDAVLHLAGRRELEALLHAALGLQFGHFRLLCHHGGGRLRTATAALLAGRFSVSRIWKSGAYMGTRAKNQLGGRGGTLSTGSAHASSIIPAQAGISGRKSRWVSTRPRPSPG